MTMTRHHRFDTPGIAPRERFDYWRGWYSQAVDAPMQLDPIGPLPRDFRASAELLGIGEVDIVELRCGPALARWAREATEPADRLRLAIVAPAPDATGSWHGREIPLATGAVSLLGNTDGRWSAPDGLRAVQVNVPRAAVPVADTDVDLINDQSRIRHDPTFATLIRPALTGLAGRLDTLAGVNATELGGLWISLMNMFVRSVLGDDTNGTDSAEARRLLIRRYIRANLGDPRLSPATIADAVHVSRRTLYATLASGGEGVATAIRRERVERAHTMLADPSHTRSIGEIASTVGLPNQAHFSRVFRAHYGASPSEIRLSARDAAADGERP
jgi:AraC-like DNA-binding protein